MTIIFFIFPEKDISSSEGATSFIGNTPLRLCLHLAYLGVDFIIKLITIYVNIIFRKFL